MEKISIIPKSFLPWGEANKISFNVDFYLGMSTFNIIAQFYNDETPIGATVLLYVSLDTIAEWKQTAEQEPEKGSFLDFTIIEEWCLNRLDLVKA